MVTVTGRNCSPIGVAPGPVAVPLNDSAALPGAIVSLLDRLLLVPKRPGTINNGVMSPSRRAGTSICSAGCGRREKVDEFEAGRSQEWFRSLED